jgi:hypothetical protein
MKSLRKRENDFVKKHYRSTPLIKNIDVKIIKNINAKSNPDIYYFIIIKIKKVINNIFY